mgnify:CR=1 FL=1
MNGYELSRKWFDYSFENPTKIKPHHTAIYFFAIEHCNRLGWKKVFGFPTSMVLEAIGMKSYSSYKKYLDELVSFGFIKVHEYSKNQYSSNVIEITFNDKALDKALDKAFIKHDTKQSESTQQSIDSINKPITKNNKQRTINTSIDDSFTSFWNLYDKKVDRSKCEAKWKRLKQIEKDSILNTVKKYISSTPDSKYRKNPLTYLNGKCWNDEIEVNKSKGSLPTDNIVF